MAGATPAEIVAAFPELGQVGPASVGVLTFTGVGTSGDTIQLLDREGQTSLLLLTAGTDFAIGATAADTAANVKTAIEASALATVGQNGATLYLETVITGWESLYVTATTGSDWSFSAAALTGGGALLEMASTLASAALPSGIWGTLYFQGTLLYAAHVVAFLGRAATGGSGSAGQIASQMTIDKISATILAAPATADSGAWGSTVYGQQYLELLNSLVRPKLGIVGRRTMQRLGS